MERYTLSVGDLLLYSLHAYGGWTVHIRDTRRQQWMHQGHEYFASTEQAQAEAVTLAQSMTSQPVSGTAWVASFG